MQRRQCGLGAPLSPVLLLAVFWLASERPAHAYLDPGAGSVAAQVAIAGIAGGLFAIRNLVRGWFDRLRGARAGSSSTNRN
ncbi:MAG: hypothetical protein ACKO5K_17110 [Armatimonadota bacterium]